MKYAPITLALCLALAACHNGKFNIQHNPQPRKRYDITLTIQDAPGPFDAVTGFMQYEIENKPCIPENPVAGVRVGPIERPPIEFKRAGDNTYVGTVYLDFLQDGDFYGLGVCHWKMVAAIMEIQAGEISFNPSMSPDEFVEQQSKTQYFPKKAYDDPSFKGSAGRGMPLSDIREGHRNEFFPVTLKAKENFQ